MAPYIALSLLHICVHYWSCVQYSKLIITQLWTIHKLHLNYWKLFNVWTISTRQKLKNNDYKKFIIKKNYPKDIAAVNARRYNTAWKIFVVWCTPPYTLTCSVCYLWIYTHCFLNCPIITCWKSGMIAEYIKQACVRACVLVSDRVCSWAGISPGFGIYASVNTSHTGIPPFNSQWWNFSWVARGKMNTDLH